MVAMARAQWPIVRFAVLFYGTPLQVIKAIHQRYRVPHDYEEFTRLVCAHYPQYEQLDILNASHILSLLENIDVFRRPERLGLFLLACQAIAGESVSAKSRLLQSAYMAAKSVAVQEIIKPCMKGEEIKKAIQQHRQMAIAFAQKNPP